MRRVRAHGHVHRNRRPVLVGRRQQAVPRMRRLPEHAAERFAGANPVTRAADDGLIHLAPGFFRGAEGAIGKNGLDILAGVAGERDLEIVNRGRSVHGERGGVSPFHQVNQHRSEAAFDHVATHSPDDWFAGGTRSDQGIDHRAKRFAR